MFKRLEDAVLAFLQKRCPHPGYMVAVDILEGAGCDSDIEVKYCRRCGGVKPHLSGSNSSAIDAIAWRLPDPNIWRE